MSRLSDQVSRLLIAASLAGLLAPAVLIASPAVVEQSAVAANSCSIQTPSAPVRMSGPAVKATGKAVCTSGGVYNLQVRVQIFAKDICCPGEWKVSDSGLLNCFGCASATRSTQTLCSGTLKYLTQVSGYYALRSGFYIQMPAKASVWTTISC